jgi:plastocyanin
MSTDAALSRVPMWVFVVSVPVATLIAVVGIGFGSSGAAGGARGASSATRDTVMIKNFSFSPKRVTVRAGTTITVANDDHTTHTFTDDNGAFDTGALGAGSTSHVTLAHAGTYAYHCDIHPFMTGTVRVLP